ncbi:hypothetical protein ACFORG_10915 [Lutimaribacter marinistellae]|uniref:Uncharacterized protein n=1 Tax=Lutimaribacter marinistellae TaxID=1820329 RepID=A0ABV7TF81_9RHOB
MAGNQVEFDRRIRRLAKKHNAMAGGYRAQMRPDGLIVMKPRRSRPGISFRAIVFFIAGFFVFKGFMLASVGVATYEERVARLAEGTTAERAGAWVMNADPVSTYISETLGPWLR